MILMCVRSLNIWRLHKVMRRFNFCPYVHYLTRSLPQQDKRELKKLKASSKL
ncbi:hypothetical protein [uncultured Nostoc sp.]|uniref:hypothetical protein n=1 Tax=uncultured Nostoc sp. TaxID=340711 RepID=UPI0035CB5A27